MVRQIQRIILSEGRAGPLFHKMYGWPQADQVCYNCGTWPATIGVEIPEQTGSLSAYIPELRARGEPWRR